MRMYTFCNHIYMSSIQHGIQSAHCIVDMMRYYAPTRCGNTHGGADKYAKLIDWADNHKTMMVMGGGNVAGLQDLYEFVNVPDNTHPYGLFYEDAQSLNDTLTCVGICLPESIYEAAAKLRRKEALWINDSPDIPNYTLYVDPTPNSDEQVIHYSTFDHDLVERLNTYGLAH